MRKNHLFSLTIIAGLWAVMASGCAAQLTQNAQDVDKKLLEPSKLVEKAPNEFKVKFVTTRGDFIIHCHRDWAPNGTDRFYNMVKAGFFKDTAIFRAIKGFMFQFGIHGTPAVAKAWGDANIKDDPSAGKSNVPGTISFAQTGRPNSRSSQMFINLGNNSMLDRARGGGAPFVPFGEVVKGMDVVNSINTEYGENRGNVQGEFRTGGNAYIKEKFPNIDFIKSVEFVKDSAEQGSSKKGN